MATTTPQLTHDTLGPLSPQILAEVLAAPVLRVEAVARGRSVLAERRWHRDVEVAGELIDCLVAQRLP